MGMDWLNPSRNSEEEQGLEQWWRDAMAGWARRHQTPAHTWRKIRPGIQAGPAKGEACASPRWAYFLDIHTWVCLAGLCAVVAGLLLSILSTAATYPDAGGPLGVDRADALSGRAILLEERDRQAVWLGLLPAQDPLLHHRREGG